MQISVKLLDGEKLEFNVNEDSCTIGRSPKCQIVIAHDGVSRQHCLLEVKNGEAFVTDLASTNGVMIDGVKIPPNVRTEFKTYLPLSFGPVQSLLVNLDEEATNSGRGNTLLKGVNVSENLTHTRVIRDKKEALKPAPAAASKPAPRKKSVDPKMILATLLAVGIMAFAYHLHQMQEGTGEAPVEVEQSQVPVEYY